MSTEIDELEKRVASLEDEFRAVFGKAETIKPAPGSDADHPPVGYVLVPSASADKIKSDWLVWAWDQGPWQAFTPGSIGLPRNQSDYAVSRPIPANEGDSRPAESVTIPAGWVAHVNGPHINEKTRVVRDGRWTKILPDLAWQSTEAQIVPDPSITWGEGYEAILPTEATKDDWRLCDGDWLSHSICMDGPKKIGWWGDAFPWRRRIPATTPTEPARDLSAEVERLEAELGTTKRLLAESLVERDRLKNLHDARKVRIEGFRDVLRERLGDLV